MSRKEDIKQKRLQLDAATFQNLCDSYLFRSHNLNFVSLGGKPGTYKTTNGTPDTYYTDGDEYTFVEYTTQVKELYTKIKIDLNKCLNEEETHIPCNKIQKIICVHLSSNLPPKQDSSLKSICSKKGIPLILIGIDKLAEDLYQKHQSLAKDYLNLPIDTSQIMELPGFSKDYNSKRFSTPIDTEFMFRDDELQQIYDAFKESDIVILTGPAGCGKTRLALYYAEKYSKVDLWLKQYIKINASYENTIVYLFNIIDESELEYYYKIQYIKEFLLNNDSLDLFKKISLFPEFVIYTNSIIPIYEERIRYINELLVFFKGTKWLNHKLYIENYIKGITQVKENEQVNEFLGGNFRSIN